MMITFPPRRMTLHFSHIFRTLGRTFISWDLPDYLAAPVPGRGRARSGLRNQTRSISPVFQPSNETPLRCIPPLRVGQDPGAVRGHGHRVLEMGREAAVLGHDRPV